MSVSQLAPNACRSLPTLTYFQPWATLIAIGAKRLETTMLGAPCLLINRRMLIQASTNSSRIEIRGRLRERMANVLEHAGFALDSLPRGVIAGTALLRGCHKIKAVADDILELDDERVVGSDPNLRCIHLPYQERVFGLYQPGRWVWCFSKAGVVLGWEAGTVKRFNNATGYGFIARSDGTDVFVHRSIVPEGVVVKEGDVVSFQVAVGEKGLMAIALRRDADCGGTIHAGAA